MSTDKFHINDASPGNDTHSNFLRRMGYGDLLNRPGRQEMTIDTASMYKSAGDASNTLTGAGIAAGGLAGSLAADYTDASALGRLLMTVAGAGAGGVGGHLIGRHIDKSEVDGVPGSRRHRQAINAATIGSIGALAGYGTTKYLAGSKNNIYNTLGAAAGGSIGALVGSQIAAPVNEQIATEQDKEAVMQADKLGLKGDQRNSFIRDYTASMDREKDNEGIADTIKSIIGRNPTEMDKVIAKYKGEEIPTEADFVWYKGVPVGAETFMALTAASRNVADVFRHKAELHDIPLNMLKYPVKRLKWYSDTTHLTDAGKWAWGKGKPYADNMWAKGKPALSAVLSLLSRGRIKL